MSGPTDGLVKREFQLNESNCLIHAYNSNTTSIDSIDPSARADNLLQRLNEFELSRRVNTNQSNIKIKSEFNDRNGPIRTQTGIRLLSESRLTNNNNQIQSHSIPSSASDSASGSSFISQPETQYQYQYQSLQPSKYKSTISHSNPINPNLREIDHELAELDAEGLL